MKDLDLLNLPNFLNNNSHAKVRDMNNSAYVDGFFSYLSSKLVNKYKFVHGIQFYGSYLGIKNDFVYNASDELDLLLESKFFHEHKNKLFKIDEKYDNSHNDSRSYKIKLDIDDNSDLSDFQVIDLNHASCDEANSIEKTINCSPTNDTNENEINEFDLISIENINQLNDEYNELINSNKNKNSKSISSDCSSRTSHTSCSDDAFNSNHFSDNEDENSYDDNDDNHSSKEGSYETVDEPSCDSYTDEDTDISSVEDEDIQLTIKKLPISVICLEKCENTLDSYMIDNDLSDDEWSSILMQIVMILITYQKVFNFTHNDLHTNNIMYNLTDKKFIYYKYNNLYYKVPTYGKIYKIIDFGRAIYKYKDFVYCSDSFHKNGDASTQYNFEPYMNNKKPRLEPNYSFDLCRLACSMYDILCDENEKETKISLLIKEWCKDDKGRNVLYKTNGDERYPDFKLYKMIVRTVFNHLPQNQLKREIFSQFLVSKNKLKKNCLDEVMNIDNMV